MGRLGARPAAGRGDHDGRDPGARRLDRAARLPLVGQGVHGYIRPDGRYDDIFFYDLNAHRWICIYPGIDTKTFVEDIKKGEFKLNDDGQFADKNDPQWKAIAAWVTGAKE